MTLTYISELVQAHDRADSIYLLKLQQDAFEIYHKVQEQVSQATPNAFSILPALRNASAGAGGTTVANVITYPLDLVCTRLQVQQKSAGTKEDGSTKRQEYDSVVDAIRKIYGNEGGIPAFYNGIAGDTLKAVLDSFLFFLAYNMIWRLRKTYVPTTKNPVIQAAEGLSIGFAAGAFTKGLTCPIQNVVSKQQTQSAAEEQTVREIINDIYARHGLAGFWAGYSANLLMTLNPSLTFFLDAFLRRVLRVGQEPGPATTFILAANGKATANVLMYPVKVVKSRAQIESSSEKSTSHEGKNASAQSANFENQYREPHKKSHNPFTAVRTIAQKEGIAALYAGVWGELFKGFFSHGLTMLVKEQIPKLAIQLYYATSMLLRRRNRFKSR